MEKKIKILFVGDTTHETYVHAFYKAALSLENVEAYELGFGKLNTVYSRNNMLLRLERHYKCGYHVMMVNKALLHEVDINEPDIVFLYNCDIVSPGTVKRIAQKSYVAMYYNDNPFSTAFKKYVWNKARNCVKYANIVYSFRYENINQFYKIGARKVKLMRAYYIKNRNYYIEDSLIRLDVPDVCFVGHFEPDERMEYIKALLDQGIDVGVPETWRHLEIEGDHLEYLSDTHHNYNEILNKAKIALVFLSKINKDTYTTRNFEIPVVKTLMVTPYNEDIATLFEEDKEAVFYRGKKEFVEKVLLYLQNEELRKRVAEAGYRRVISDGHEAHDRVMQLLADFSSDESKKR